MYNALYMYTYYITPRTLTYAHTYRGTTQQIRFPILLQVVSTDSSVDDYRRFYSRLIVRGDTEVGLLHNW